MRAAEPSVGLCSTGDGGMGRCGVGRCAFWVRFMLRNLFLDDARQLVLFWGIISSHAS